MWRLLTLGAISGGVLALVASVGAPPAHAAGSGDHTHAHEHGDQEAMLERMQELHAGHDHEHDFTLLAHLSEEDMHRTIDTLIDLGLALPPMSSERGREVFMAKGCIVCHAINEVGVDVGPSLRASDMPEAMNAFEFAARMWRGAPAMVQMQEDLLGEPIELSGQELADLVAFTHDAEAQSQVTAEMVPDQYRALLP